MGDISTNFSMSELCVSQTAIRQGRAIVPDKNERNYLIMLVRSVLQPVRELVGRPVVITSGLRPPWLNTMINGSKTSQHMKGQAVDFVVPGMHPLNVCHKIKQSDIKFDQLICEFNEWVHISYFPALSMRNEILTARSMDGTTIYENGLDAKTPANINTLS